VARGESPKERPSFPGAAIGAAFLAFCLCAITGVALTTRECNAPPASVAVTPEPFVGTIASFHSLSWRDTERVRNGAAGVVPDAASARALLESSLTTRGYVPAPAEGLAPVVTLPGDFETPSMAGSCGVLVVVADGAGTLTSAEVSGEGGATETFVAHDPSALAIPLCGAQRVHVLGSGAAGAHVWHYPGLTPEVVEATGLPPEVVLAHAEAEVLLRVRNLVPRDEVAVIEVPSGAGPQTIPLTRTAPSGCVPMVAVVVGGGDPIGSWSPVDRITDRALLGLAVCATRTDANPTLMVPSGTARVYVRPYEALRTGASAPVGVSAGALHVVREADLALPTPLVEAPMP
jgi:hypothetical protein